MNKTAARYRLKVWLGHTRVVGWLQARGEANQLWWIPPIPALLKGWSSAAPSLGPKSLEVGNVALELRSTLGVFRDPEREEAAFRAQPLQLWTELYTAGFRMLKRQIWVSVLPTLPLRGRIRRRLQRSHELPASVTVSDRSSRHLSQLVKTRAAELGISAVGIAQRDPKYTYSPFLGQDLGDRVIVCALEMNWAASQTFPSARAERGAQQASVRLADLCVRLAEYIRGLGYAVAPVTLGEGQGISIHYGVAAGLGQLGLNGQLLTPFAGSRVRLMLVHTDAPLELDQAKDYGIPGICDACKACVRRCPPGAITSVRKWHRGVYKAKIKAERCLPTMIQTGGCAVCIKVCPVQRYGLAAVLDEFRESGTVMGAHSDELEGFDWPLDGLHYPPDEKPKIAATAAFLHPNGYVHEPKPKHSTEGRIDPTPDKDFM